MSQKKSFLLLSQCVRSKRNVKSLNGSYYTTARLHFGAKNREKKFKPFGQTPPPYLGSWNNIPGTPCFGLDSPPLPRVTEQHPRYPLYEAWETAIRQTMVGQRTVSSTPPLYPPKKEMSDRKKRKLARGMKDTHVYRM